jgi:uncharacterized protein
MFDKLDIAKLLISSGADVTLKDDKGNSALYHSKIKGDKAIIDLLTT